MDRPEVFISVGRTWTPDQEAFVKDIEGLLDARGLEAFTIGRNTFTAAGPLDRVLDVMRTCHGLIAVAFARSVATAGTDHVGPDGNSVQFTDRRYSTPWHHVEIGMAHTLKLPVLVILERGVFEEGLLEDKYGWYLYRTKLDSKAIQGRELQGILTDWCERVRKRKNEPPQEVQSADLTVGAILRGMKVGQLWATLGAIAALTVGSVSLGLWLGTGGKSAAAAPAAAQPSALPAPSGSTR